MSNNQYHPSQCAKKVVSNCLQLVDFVIRLVNSGLSLPNRQVKFWLGEFINYYRRTVINPAQQKFSGDKLK